ncbi:DUF6252 family protein [Aequorivita sp. Q41]|uniref:DUF6252 family protein n=1 Tax=Aequorivita sp. Q41 TaxID=3153300 RepID=UPI0032423055
MKNILFALLIALSLFSCEDIQTNEIALQAKIDDRLYLSADARASLNEDGGIVIQGFTEVESITMRLSSLEEGSFEIAKESSNYAVYEDVGGNIYSTKPEGLGVVVLSEVNRTNKTLSGTFKFNAFLAGIDTVYVSKGVFYNVSYAGGAVTDPTTQGTFRAMVDGVPFLPFIVNGRSTANRILLSGSTANAKMLISVPLAVEVGAYILPKAGFNGSYQNGADLENALEGLINITEHDIANKLIKGDFYFMTRRSDITEGAFSINYK